MATIHILKTRMAKYDKANPVGEYDHLSDDELLKRLEDIETYLKAELGCYRPLSNIDNEIEHLKIEQSLIKFTSTTI